MFTGTHGNKKKNSSNKNQKLNQTNGHENNSIFTECNRIARIGHGQYINIWPNSALWIGC
jgi:hypothetical protein